jgi:hypothetical protein
MKRKNTPQFDKEKKGNALSPSRLGTFFLLSVLVSLLLYACHLPSLSDDVGRHIENAPGVGSIKWKTTRESHSTPSFRSGRGKNFFSTRALARREPRFLVSNCD